MNNQTAYTLAALGLMALACTKGNPGYANNQSLAEEALIPGVKDSNTAQQSTPEYGDASRSILRHYRSNSVWQTASWGYPVLDGKGVEIEHYIPATDSTTTHQYSTSFHVKFVAAEKSNISQSRETFYVVGQTDLGGHVIEKWVHKPNKFQMPASPVTFKLTRSTIYEGTSLGIIHSMEVDPFGAFMLLAHSNPSMHLTQLRLISGYPEISLLDPTTEALLVNGVSGIRRAEHNTDGLLWLVFLDTDRGNPVALGAIVLRDIDSDSVLDDWTAYDHSQMRSFYPHRYTKDPWTDDFRNYR